MMRIRSWSCIGVIVWAVGAATPAHSQVVALPQLVLTPQLKASSTAAPIKPSELNGVVKDELGKPLSGAVVSALGSTSAFAISNEDGHFTFRNLPAGPYLIRAHLQRLSAVARSRHPGQCGWTHDLDDRIDTTTWRIN